MARSLSMELVRVTEAAAQASARWMGRGLKDEADGAATSYCYACQIRYSPFHRWTP